METLFFPPDLEKQQLIKSHQNSSGFRQPTPASTSTETIFVTSTLIATTSYSAAVCDDSGPSASPVDMPEAVRSSATVHPAGDGARHCTTGRAATQNNFNPFLTPSSDDEDNTTNGVWEKRKSGISREQQQSPKEYTVTLYFGSPEKIHFGRSAISVAESEKKPTPILRTSIANQSKPTPITAIPSTSQDENLSKLTKLSLESEKKPTPISRTIVKNKTKPTPTIAIPSIPQDAHLNKLTKLSAEPAKKPTPIARTTIKNQPKPTPTIAIPLTPQDKQKSKLIQWTIPAAKQIPDIRPISNYRKKYQGPWKPWHVRRMEQNLDEQLELTLLGCDMDKYCKNFQNQGISYLEFLRLSNVDLIDIGISDLTERAKLCQVIDEISTTAFAGRGKPTPTIISKNIGHDFQLSILEEVYNHLLRLVGDKSDTENCGITKLTELSFANTSTLQSSPNNQYPAETIIAVVNQMDRANQRLIDEVFKFKAKLGKRKFLTLRKNPHLVKNENTSVGVEVVGVINLEETTKFGKEINLKVPKITDETVAILQPELLAFAIVLILGSVSFFGYRKYLMD